MDLYSEELTLDIINVDVDANQEAFEKSDNIDSEVISKNLVTSHKVNHEVSPESKKDGSQALGEKCDIILECGIKNDVDASATEISSKTEVSEERNPEENSENKDDSQITIETIEENLVQTNATELVEKKKKGRRTLQELRQLLPTRGSTRKRKFVSTLDYDNSVKMRCAWTIREKEQLLRGLEEFGIDNIKGIMTHIPTKSDRAIENQVRLLKEIGRNNLQKTLNDRKKSKMNAFSNNVSRLTDWSKHFENIAKNTPQRLFALSNVFLLISEYGTFPKPSECEGIDFGAMYRYLHCMLNGRPYYGVNGRTADILLQCLTNVLKYLQKKPKLNLLLPHLLQETNTKTFKTYSRAQTRPFPPSTLEKPDAFLKLPGINPLNIPAALLLKGDDSEDEDTEYDEHDDDSSDDNDFDEDEDEDDDDDD